MAQKSHSETYCSWRSKFCQLDLSQKDIARKRHVGISHGKSAFGITWELISLVKPQLPVNVNHLLMWPWSWIFLSDSTSRRSLTVFGSSFVRNLGILLDESLNLDKHIYSVIVSSFYQLSLLSKIKPFLNHKTWLMAVHTCITSCLDYCDSLYWCSSKPIIDHLKLDQNAAARFLHNSRKSTHITPIQRTLHWLPIKFRFDSKIFLFVNQIQQCRKGNDWQKNKLK